MRDSSAKDDADALDDLSDFSASESENEEEKAEATAEGKGKANKGKAKASSDNDDLEGMDDDAIGNPVSISGAPDDIDDLEDIVDGNEPKPTAVGSKPHTRMTKPKRKKNTGMAGPSSVECMPFQSSFCSSWLCLG